MNSLISRHLRLKQLLKELAPLAVAFSGGADSSLLLKVAYNTLGAGCIAVTVDAPYHFRQEIDDAARFAEQLGVKHLIIPFDPAAVPGLFNNPPDRCYLCKKAMLNLCHAFCSLPLIDGSTRDDQTAHRPGRRALQELGVRSPLDEAGFSKQDIRNLGRELGLTAWDKPAQSCLLTRFPLGYQISYKDLLRVEKCERMIKGLGFSVVCARSLEDTARIETEDPEQAQAMFRKIEQLCRQAGFTTVEIDPAGYRCGLFT